MGAHGLLSGLVRPQEGSAVAINLSGCQRTLSQRIALEAPRLATAPPDQRRGLGCWAARRPWG